MKYKLTEIKVKPAPRLAHHLFSWSACLGAVILICCSASAQNLFVSGAVSLNQMCAKNVKAIPCE